MDYFDEESRGLNLVALGGGTGLSTLLAGLKCLVGERESGDLWLANLSAIVTVSDDGGSSGRLRDELQMLPPGDIRNCMIALSEDSNLLSRLFRHRFRGSGELGGHSFGNLFLAALTEVTGDFTEAVRLSSEVLASKGHIYPATISDVRLVAELADGSIVRGETQISASHTPIRRLSLEPEQCLPLPQVLKAIRAADVITVGPGSLYTSILPNLLVARVSQAIGETQATKIFICNLMTQPGETDNYTARQHLETVKTYAPEIHFDFVIVNDRRITHDQRDRYALEGAYQIGIDEDSIDEVLDNSTQVIRANLLEEGEKVRHDSALLARVVMACRQQACPEPVVPAYPMEPKYPLDQTPPLQFHEPTQSLDVLILAAGLGTRMKSDRAKVLHEIGGLPLIIYVCRTARSLGPQKIYVVVGHQASEVESVVHEEIGELAEFVMQTEQRGTGHAVMAARTNLASNDSLVLVLSGDVPLIRSETLNSFIDDHKSSRAVCSILSVKLENPTGYGRIVRDDQGSFARITEQKDATPEEQKIREINSGIYCFDSRKLFSALERVNTRNQQGEYYLTDVPAILLSDGEAVNVYVHNDAREVSGINTRAELAEFENLLRRNTIRRLMTEGGVTFIDPSHAYISTEAEVGRDCVIYPDVSIEGKSRVGSNCEIRSGTRITNSRLADHVVVKDHCVIVDSEIESNCSVGPFAHLRMNTKLEERSVVGNFVEVKKSRLGRGSKSMHLTYLGDATIGEKTNIGAGTITCNYDGKHKHETIIEDGVKIGSDTMLIAPVRVGKGSVTAAGSVVTEDVPPNTLVAGVPAVVKKKLKASDE